MRLIVWARIWFFLMSLARTAPLAMCPVLIEFFETAMAVPDSATTNHLSPPVSASRSGHSFASLETKTTWCGAQSAD